MLTYVRQHTSAYVSIRQHTSAYVSIVGGDTHVDLRTSAYVSIRQHTSAYVSIRQHTSAYVGIRQHSRGDTHVDHRAPPLPHLVCMWVWVSSTSRYYSSIGGCGHDAVGRGGLEAHDKEPVAEGSPARH